MTGKEVFEMTEKKGSDKGENLPPYTGGYFPTSSFYSYIFCFYSFVFMLFCPFLSSFFPYSRGYKGALLPYSLANLFFFFTGEYCIV